MSRRRRLPDGQVALAVEVFRMLADGTRIQILWALIGQELSVNELASRVGKPGPSVSQHLAKLRMARLVRTRREGTQMFYRLENEHVGRLVTDAVYNAEHAGPGVPSHHLGDTQPTELHPDPASLPAAGRRDASDAHIPPTRTIMGTVTSMATGMDWVACGPGRTAVSAPFA